MSDLAFDDPIPRQTDRKQVRDEAAAYIRELIISGRLPPGSRLPLAAIAEKIDSSNTPVREALLLLTQDGWIIQQPNKGFTVSPIRRGDVADAYLVNAYASGELTFRAAGVIDDATIGELRRMDTEARGLGPEDATRIETLNAAFHQRIYALARADRLLWFVTAAQRFAPRHYWMTIAGWFEFNRPAHTPIVEALAEHDGEAARRLMSEHVKASGDLLLAHLDRQQFWRSSPEEER